MPEDHIERRKHLRLEVYLDKLQVDFGGLGTELTTGVALDISRGGMKVCLAHAIPEPLVGDDCLVFFVEDPQDRVSAKAKLGKLLRMEAVGQYAIEFDSPLEVLNMGSDSETVESGSGAPSEPMDEAEQRRFERIGEPSFETPESEQAAERRV